MAIPFDVGRGEVQGIPLPVIDGLLMGSPWDLPIAHYTVAADGTFAYLSGPMLATTQSLHRVNRRP
jgi:hypothetical protein